MKTYESRRPSGWCDGPAQTVSIQVDAGNVYRKQNQCYQSRGKSVISLVDEAFSQIKIKLHPFSIKLFVGDFWKDCKIYTFSDNLYSDKLIPDFNFDSWPEIGVQDYEETCKQILNQSREKYKYDRLFWAGNVNTHPRRKEFANIAIQLNDKIEFHNTGNWSIVPGKQMLKNNSGTFTSLPDHCNYKYLIDIEGNGYSGRVKHLLHTGRPLFYQKRYWNEYWFFKMEPFVHYIPIENDFSDFNQKFNFILENDDVAEEIGNNAREFAIKNLRRKNAVEKYRDLFVSLGTKN